MNLLFENKALNQNTSSLMPKLNSTRKKQQHIVSIGMLYEVWRIKQFGLGVQFYDMKWIILSLPSVISGTVIWKQTCEVNISLKNINKTLYDLSILDNKQMWDTDLRIAFLY